jgi:hypothetical protein
MKRKDLNKLIKEAYEELFVPLREEEGNEQPEDEREEEQTNSTEELLNKFPTLERSIVALFTEEYGEFIESIDFVAPKPSTFKVNTTNGQYLYLKYTGKGFEAEIMGKKYALNMLTDYQQALDKLNELLRLAAPEAPAEPADVDGGEANDFGSGGEGDFGDDAGGADDAPADTGDEEIEFDEPGEEPDAE